MLVVLLLNSACNQQSTTQQKIEEYQQDNEYSDEIRLKSLNEALAANPENATALYKRSEVYLKTGDPDKALADARGSVRVDTTQGMFYAQLALCYRKIKRIDSAAMAIGKAKARGYSSPGLLVSSGEIMLILRQYDKALDELNQALDLAPTYAEAYFYKGFVYEERGDTAKAISSYTTAIEQNPQYVDAYNKLGVLAMNRHNFSQARQYLLSGLRFAPQDAYLNYNLGLLSEATNRRDSAEQFFTKAVFHEPSLYLAQYNLGLYRYKDRRYLEAATYLESSLQYKPDQPAARFYLALSRENLGNLEEAIAQYRQVIALGNGYTTDAQRGLARATARIHGQQRDDELPKDSTGI